MATKKIARAVTKPSASETALTHDRDEVGKKLTQARALTVLLFGETHSDAGFRGLSSERQDEVLWLLNDLVEDSLQAWQRIDSARSSRENSEYSA